MSLPRLLLWIQLGIFGACASEAVERDADVTHPPARTRGPLIVPAGWRQAEAEDDPFEDRPEIVDCQDAAVMPELVGGSFALGIETGACRYYTGIQATLRNVLAGDEIQATIAHFELTAPSPGEAHASVLLDGLSVLDERIPIPRPAAVIVRRVRVERTIPAGSTVLFHLHNHGANSWAFVELSTGP